MRRVVVGDVTLVEDEPGIVTVDYGTALASARLVQDVVERSLEVWGKRRVGMVVHVASGTDLAKLGELVAQEEVADFLIAAAIVTPGKLAQLMGNLYMRVQTSRYPQRQFTDAEKALAWVKHQVAQEEARG